MLIYIRRENIIPVNFNIHYGVTFLNQKIMFSQLMYLILHCLGAKMFHDIAVDLWYSYRVQQQNIYVNLPAKVVKNLQHSWCVSPTPPRPAPGSFPRHKLGSAVLDPPTVWVSTLLWFYLGWQFWYVYTHKDQVIWQNWQLLWGEGEGCDNITGTMYLYLPV